MGGATSADGDAGVACIPSTAVGLLADCVAAAALAAAFPASSPCFALLEVPAVVPAASDGDVDLAFGAPGTVFNGGGGRLSEVRGFGPTAG